MWIPRIVLPVMLVLAVSGCHSLRMNQGRVISILAAAQVGAFRGETGHWPAGVEELAARECPALDQYTDNAFEPRPPHPGVCEYFSSFPYRLALRNRSGDLLMELLDARGNPVCRILVVDPDRSHWAFSARVELKTTLFKCPGEGERW